MLYSLKDEINMLRNTHQYGQQFKLLCQQIFYANQFHTKSYRVLFFGTDDYATRCLKEMVGNMKCVNEKIIGKLEVVSLPKENLSVVKYATAEALKTYTWPDLPSLESFDIAVVVSFGKLMPASLIQSFRFGMINVHASLLPKLRGPAPIARAIEAGLKSTGVSVIQIAPKRFDHGKILCYSNEISIDDMMKVDELARVLADVGARLCLDTLKKLPERIKDAREQIEKDASFARKLTTEDTHLNWHSMTAEDIWNKYRAFGCKKDHLLRCTYNGKLVDGNVIKFVELKLVSNDLFRTLNVASEPGSVLFHKRSKSLLIACKRGYISCTKLIISGRKPLTAVDFNNGFMQARLKRGEQILFCDM